MEAQIINIEKGMNNIEGKVEEGFRVVQAKLEKDYVSIEKHGRLEDRLGRTEKIVNGVVVAVALTVLGLISTVVANWLTR